MPDTTRPYGHIEMEIDRLKYASQDRRERALFHTHVADTHDMDRRELESALRKQIQVDNEQSKA